MKDFLTNYIVITTGIFILLALLFGIGVGLIKLFSFNPLLFGIVVIVLVTSGAITYFVTNDKKGE